MYHVRHSMSLNANWLFDLNLLLCSLRCFFMRKTLALSQANECSKTSRKYCIAKLHFDRIWHTNLVEIIMIGSIEKGCSPMPRTWRIWLQRSACIERRQYKCLCSGPNNIFIASRKSCKFRFEFFFFFPNVWHLFSGGWPSSIVLHYIVDAAAVGRFFLSLFHTSIKPYVNLTKCPQNTFTNEKPIINSSANNIVRVRLLHIFASHTHSKWLSDWL